MVKDERHLDRYDRAFSASFSGLEKISTDEVLNAVDIPREWLEKLAEKHLSPEEMAEIQSAGGFDADEKLRERLVEQKDAIRGQQMDWHGGHIPFGAYGYNPEGVRIATNHDINARSKCGTNANSKIWMTVLNWYTQYQSCPETPAQMGA